MPRRLLMQTFGRWHSGNFANGTAGAAFAGSHQLGKTPIRAVPVAHLSYGDVSQDVLGRDGKERNVLHCLFGYPR